MYMYNYNTIVFFVEFSRIFSPVAGVPNRPNTWQRPQGALYISLLHVYMHMYMHIHVFTVRLN